MSDVLKYGYTVPIHCPVRLQVHNDPLGPVNKVISLVREDGTLIASKLHPVPVGAEVRLGWDAPRFSFSAPGWRALAGVAIEDDDWQPTTRPYAIWWAEVDGKRILEVPEHETWPPIPPKPTPPLPQRMRTALRQQLRADADWIAGRLGYHRADECGGWEE